MRNSAALALAARYRLIHAAARAKGRILPLETNITEDSNSAAAVELSGIELSLPVSEGPDVDILKGIDLHVKQGLKVGLVGPSGSGKTSLLTVVAGLQRQTAGKLAVMGRDYASCDEEQLASFRRTNIGVVFQNFHLLPAMTAVENVALPLEMSNDPGAEEKSASCLEMVGLGHRLGHFPHQLSGGEMQRTAIARAFAARPRLILADEPTGNLDGETGEAVMEVLDRLVDETEATLLFITHDTSLLTHLDDVIRMRDGRLENTLS